MHFLNRLSILVNACNGENRCQKYEYLLRNNYSRVYILEVENVKFRNIFPRYIRVKSSIIIYVFV